MSRLIFIIVVILKAAHPRRLPSGPSRVDDCKCNGTMQHRGRQCCISSLQCPAQAVAIRALSRGRLQGTRRSDSTL
jgi:hypothetical protein